MTEPNPALSPDTAPHHADRFQTRGILFIVSSPSGAGKSTIARKLLKSEPGLEMSVSATTRDPRPGEVDGVDYHFVTVDRFKEMVAANEFLEWAHVFGHRYGTPRSPVEQALSEGRDVLFDIDWQGAQQLAEMLSACSFSRHPWTSLNAACVRGVRTVKTLSRPAWRAPQAKSATGTVMTMCWLMMMLRLVLATFAPSCRPNA
jgi:hypothetical protein